MQCGLIPRLSQLALFDVLRMLNTWYSRQSAAGMLVIRVCPSCLESPCGRSSLSSYWTVVPLQMSLISIATVCINRIARGLWCILSKKQPCNAYSPVTSKNYNKNLLKIMEGFPVSFWVTRQRHFWTELTAFWLSQLFSPTCSITHIE
jgi:hypothetical protein